MEELIKRMSEKLGISQEAARKAVIMTADYLKYKLPDAFDRQVDVILGLPEVTEEDVKELGLFQIP